MMFYKINPTINWLFWRSLTPFLMFSISPLMCVSLLFVILKVSSNFHFHQKICKQEIEKYKNVAIVLILSIRSIPIKGKIYAKIQ